MCELKTIAQPKLREDDVGSRGYQPLPCSLSAGAAGTCRSGGTACKRGSAAP